MKRKNLKRQKIVKKSRKQNKSSFVLLTGIYFSVIFYAFYLLCSQQVSLNKYRSQIEMYNKEIETKNKRISLYENKEKNITKDEYIEEVARKSFGLVKPYEKVFVDVNKE